MLAASDELIGTKNVGNRLLMFSLFLVSCRMSIYHVVR